MNAVLAAILNTLWQSAALAAAVWIALRFTRGANAATRHAIWWTVLAVAVLLPFIPTTTTTPAADPRPNLTTIVDLTPAPIGPRQPLASIATGPRGPLELPAGNWTNLLFAAWLAAALIQFARAAGSYVYLRRLKRDARPAAPDLTRNFDAWILSCRVGRPVRLLISKRITSPIAVGFRHPAVLLPEPLLAEFDEADLDHVLLHELAHMARRDDWTNLAARLAAGVFAFHPVARFALRQIDRDREMACDDWVVSMTGAARPYASCLTRLFELCRGRNGVLLASGMATRASHLGERIEMLLRSQRQWVAKASLAKIVFAAVALIAAGIAFSQTPRLLAIAQDVPPTPTVAPAPPEPAAVPEPPEAATPPEPAEPAAPAPAQPPAPPAPPSNGGFLAGLVAAGYRDLSVDDIIYLKSNGISPDYLAGMARSGWGRLNPRDLVELKNQGVSPDYARDVHDAGFQSLQFREVVSLRQNGVNAESMRHVHDLGFGPYTAGEAIALHNHGVNLDLFRAFKDAGWKTLSAQEAIDARQAGVNAGSLAEARRYGSLTLKQIVRLKQAGVL